MSPLCAHPTSPIHPDLPLDLPPVAVGTPVGTALLHLVMVTWHLWVELLLPSGFRFLHLGNSLLLSGLSCFSWF